MPALEELFQSAVRQHQAGELDEAIACYRTLLEHAPEHADTRHLLGVALHQQGRHEDAVECIGQVVESSPAAPYLNNLGNALRALGRLEEALAAYERAVALDPEYAGGWYNLGRAREQAGRTAAALDAFRESVSLAPEDEQALCCLGRLLIEAGEPQEAILHLGRATRVAPGSAAAHRLLARAHQDRRDVEEARAAFQRALAEDPDDVESLSGLGLLYYQTADHASAIKTLDRALQLDPRHVESLVNRGNVSLRTDDPEGAVRFFQRAYAVAPDEPKVQCSLGVGLQELGRLDDAEPFVRRAVESAPELLIAHVALGNLRRAQFRYEEALACYERALALDFEYPEAHYNVGKVLTELGEHERALPAHEHAMRLAPTYADTHLNRFYSLMALGRVEEAWPEYEWRFRRKGAPRTVPGPEWDGGSLAGRNVFVYGEQGLGDEVMFAACVPDLEGVVENCVLECSVRLVDLFRRSFPFATVLARPFDVTEEGRRLVADADVYVPSGTLTARLRPDLDAFPRPQRYLVPDPERVARWRERYAELGEGPKIGISWFGGFRNEARVLRSTRLEQWRTLLETPGAHFVNLQYGDVSQELARVRETLGVTVHDFEDGNPMKKLDDFAARIAGLDLVVSVDNSTVHIAGAIGQNVWALLPQSPDWRWMGFPHHTVWYRTVRLFRQAERFQWEPVFRRVRSEIERLQPEGFDALPAVPDEAPTGLRAGRRLDGSHEAPSPLDVGDVDFAQARVLRND